MNVCSACKTPMGYFAFSDGGEVVFYTLFSNDPKKAAEEFIGDDAREFLSHLKDYEVEFNTNAMDFFREMQRDLAASLGFTKSVEGFNSFIADFYKELSKRLMLGSIRKDKLLVQALNACEDVTVMINNLNERLYEWYSLHYPGVPQASLAKMILKHGKRENFPGYKEGHGISINEKDGEIFRTYAELIARAEEEKKRLEAYVREICREVMPNTTSLIDELLAAKLMSIAGSLEKLARMPASSIQLLGAEKALFRHLKNKRERAPKYGIIFVSGWVQNAQQQKRGHAARALAAKIMVAARIDYYSGRLDETLRSALEAEMKKI